MGDWWIPILCVDCGALCPSLLHMGLLSGMYLVSHEENEEGNELTLSICLYFGMVLSSGFSGRSSSKAMA